MLSSKQVGLFFCGSGFQQLNDRGWKPLPQKQNLLDDKVVQRTMSR
jgi:hypothetical protein